LLPGAGFEVVASDCLAGLVARQVAHPMKLDLALRGLNAISRGSAASVFALWSDRILVRRQGKLVGVEPGALTREIDFGNGPTETTAVTWADVSSAHHSTGIPDITVYYEATPIVRMGLGFNRHGSWLARTPVFGWWQKIGLGMLPDGPSDRERAVGKADVVASVEGRGGQRAEARLHTPEVYTFTATTAAALAERVLAGDCKPGFQTPATAYGADFVLSLPGVSYEEVSVARGRGGRR
ncbi:MAG TPA: saccharopine dehydrogenase, partial [Polyangia bacterium]